MSARKRDQGSGIRDQGKKRGRAPRSPIPDPRTLNPFTEAERAAWRPVERVPAWQWVERERSLGSGESPQPGPWRNSNAPYLVGIMALADTDGIEFVIIRKSAQGGGSEAMRCLLAAWAKQDPDPALWVLADEETGRKVFSVNILPLFQNTPALRAEATGRARDQGLGFIKLRNDFSLRLGHAGSANSLHTIPARYVFLDEPKAYPAWSGKEANPVRLALQRTKSFGRRQKVILCSAPTIAGENIDEWYQGCTAKFAYYLPCPHCGWFARLSIDNWVLPKREAGEARAKYADRVMMSPVCFRCRHCDGLAEPRHKAAMVRAGVWATEEGIGGYQPSNTNNAGLRSAQHQPTRPADSVVRSDDWWDGERGAPKTNKVGFHFSELLCLWVDWSVTAAKSVQAEAGPNDLMDFVNNSLGEPFEHRLTRCEPGEFRVLAEAATRAPNVVPAWCHGPYGKLLMAIDVQRDSFYYVVRAFGYGFRSARVRHGRVLKYSDLWDIVNALWKNEDPGKPLMRIVGAGIDVGDHHTQQDVYAFCLRDTVRIVPMRGYAKPGGGPMTPIQLRKVTTAPPGAKRSSTDLWRCVFDSQEFSDVLQAQIRRTRSETVNGKEETLPQWELNTLIDPDYESQMASEHKVFDKKSNQWLWKLIGEGKANHYWDCEKMLQALAGYARVDLLPPPGDGSRGGSGGSSGEPTSQWATTPDGRPFLITER